MTANSTGNSVYPLMKQVPVILRARGFRLYTEGGCRLIDLWLNGGAAALGHTPPDMLRELKNTASRGLYAPFPHFTEGRYLKALSRLFPGRCFRLYAAPPPELAALFADGAAKLWRPFTDMVSPFAVEKDSPLLVPVLPGIQTWREFDGGIHLPLGLCAAAAQSEEQLAYLPPGDILPPVLLAVAARGIYDILASPRRAKPVLPRASKALQENANHWRRGGIYLTLKGKPSQEAWAALFRRFLEAGFLLPPTPSHPVVLPGELSAGEDAKLAGVLGSPAAIA